MFAVAGPVCRVACLWFVVSGLFEGVGVLGWGICVLTTYFMNDVDKIAGGGGGGSISSAVARSVAVRRMSAALYGAY